MPTVLVLASGRGERFTASGGAGSKLDAVLGERRLIEWTIAAARATGLRVHVEDRGHAGMGDSIAAAVRATSDSNGWLVLPGDLPLVRPASIRAVAALLVTNEVVVPFHQGMKGHPVGFAASCRDELLGLTGAEGAAAVVRLHAAHSMRLELDDEGIVTDIDTVEDLARAERLLSLRA